MSRFATMTEPIHADWWEDGEEVVIRVISYGEAEQIEFEATEVVTDDAGEIMVKLNLGKRRVLRTHAGISSWTFERPLSLEAVHALNPEDGQYIYDQIQALNQARSAKEQDRFRGGTGDAAEAGEAAG